jgi:hypothetical protein
VNPIGNAIHCIGEGPHRADRPPPGADQALEVVPQLVRGCEYQDLRRTQVGSSTRVRLFRA